MRIRCTTIEHFCHLADRLFHVDDGRDGLRYAPLRPAVELHPVAAGTILSAQVGHLSLRRIISGTAIARPVACDGRWLEFCKAKAGHVELSLRGSEVEFRLPAAGRQTSLGRGSGVAAGSRPAADPSVLRLAVRPARSLPRSPPMHRVDGGLLRALAQCGGVVDHRATRSCLSHLELHGRQRSITASDGRQLLRLEPWDFPWKNRIALIAANAVFTSPLLADRCSVACGLDDKAFVIAAEPWTIGLPLAIDGRFPDVGFMLARLSHPLGQVYWSQAELARFQAWLERLPNATDTAQGPAVTLRLGKSLHAEQVTEDPASWDRDRLGVQGSDPVWERCNCNYSWDRDSDGASNGWPEHRQTAQRFLFQESFCQGEGGHYRVRRDYLLTAVRLGLAELSHFGPRAPLVARSGSRGVAVGSTVGSTYVFQPLVCGLGKET